jgi:APAF-1 helical domain
LWSDELADDGYVHTNLARHFVYCGEQGVEELTALLLDFRWTERHLAASGIRSLRADFGLLRSAISGSTGLAAVGINNSVDETDFLTALDLTPAAVQLAWGSVHKNPRELACQMHGRLFARRFELAAVDKYASSVELHAEHP